MDVRMIGLGLLTGFVVAAGASAQESRPSNPGAPSAIGSDVEREVKGLNAQDFSDRQAALKRLESLISDQMKQRAQVQEVMDALRRDLATQDRALAMVTDDEAQAQVEGLLETERGLAAWTIQTMGEPAERRKALLAWGLGREAVPVLAKAYADDKRARLEGMKLLAKMPDDGASWTLSRLINDREGMVRAAAMAVAWDRKPHPDIVAALWFRAVSGPLAYAEQPHLPDSDNGGQGDTLKVDFPEGDPIEFSVEDDSGKFFDALLAGSVLIRLHAPLVEERVRRLVQERAKAGKTLALADDPDWTLVTHRLVEAYGVKEAIPLLAADALSAQTEEMGGDTNGRPYVWSRRTLAIGALCRLINKDPADFQLILVRDTGELRGPIWATDINPQAPGGGGGPWGGAGGGLGQSDGAPVRAFYAWWKEHHAEYGVKEEPSAAGVSTDRARGRARGMRQPPGNFPVPAPEGPVPDALVPNEP